jgi:hypothetical protein
VFGLSPVELLVVGVVAILLFRGRLPEVRDSLHRSVDIWNSHPGQLPFPQYEGAGLNRLARYLLAIFLGILLGWLVCVFWSGFFTRQ